MVDPDLILRVLENRCDHRASLRTLQALADDQHGGNLFALCTWLARQLEADLPGPILRRVRHDHTFLKSFLSGE